MSPREYGHFYSKPRLIQKKDATNAYPELLEEIKEFKGHDEAEQVVDPAQASNKSPEVVVRDFEDMVGELAQEWIRMTINMRGPDDERPASDDDAPDDADAAARFHHRKWCRDDLGSFQAPQLRQPAHLDREYDRNDVALGPDSLDLLRWRAATWRWPA